MSPRTLLLAAGLAVLLSAQPGRAAPAAAKTPVLIDTDIGSDIDDAFALALAVVSPELDLRGVTTVGSDARGRARIVCRLLTALGRRSVPVAWGRDPQPKSDVGQLAYGRPSELAGGRTSRPVEEPAVAFLYSRLKAHPGKITLVALGPLTNVARLLRKHPDCKPWVKRIVVMGGAVRVGYAGKPPAEAEWNIKSDIAAAKVVFTSGVSLVVAPLDATTTLKLEKPLRTRLFAAGTPLTRQVQTLYRLWGKPTPVLFDPVAVTLAFTEKFCTMEELHLQVDDKGFTRVGKGKPNARVATAVKGKEFLGWCVGRLSAGKPGEK
jgi:inosine-uridine nucleoside N-ribohydrolase